MEKTTPGNPIPSGRPLRLLIVEDNPADAELLVAILKRAGYVLSFDIADSAALYQKHLEQHSYDLILTDHNLRDWTGLDALAMLRRSGKEIPFLVVTGTLGDEAAVDYIKQGATDYLLKHRLDRVPVAVGRALREKAQREEAARLQEQILCAKRDWELTFDSVSDAVLLLDTECRVLRANRAASRLLGLEFSQLIGRCCHDVLHGAPEPRPDCPHFRLQTTDKEERGDIEEARLGKTFEATASPLRDASGAVRGCILVMHDITERKTMEEQLRQSQKMEAIGRLAGGIAHDFNNLLGVIMGYSDLLLERLGPQDPLHRSVHEIYEASARGGALVRQLLAFSRQQVLEPRVLDLNVAVSDMASMLRRVIGEDITLVVTPGSGLWKVKADPGQIEQVLLNLSFNARDAMPRGGKLTIETANFEADEPYANHHAGVETGRYVMLAVSDTGAGMNAEVKAHIFEPFFTTKEKGKGTGLGLATVYGIVRQSGGHIWVYSESGMGTTFKVYLPRYEGAAEAAAAVEAAAEVRPRGSETVLVVEDDDALRELARTCLHNSGYQVLVAANGAEALEIVRQFPGPIQLMMTDMIMPGMNGSELAEHLAASHPSMKVLYVSGYAPETMMHHGLTDLNTAFLQKPYRSADLARKVRAVLEQ